MARPHLSLAVKWEKYENAVHAVFLESLRRLAALERLSAAEEPINLELYSIAVVVHHELLNSAKGSLQFTIDPDSTSLPAPGDSARSPRIKKRPDFKCLIVNAQASDPRRSQMAYYLECKRLGTPEDGLVFNQLYSEKGINRFVIEEHEYAKGCDSAAMIGYVQNMTPDEILAEVNTHASARKLPSLARAAGGWANRGVTKLTQDPLNRSCLPDRILLHHFWIDLRHCRFDIPSNQPPQNAEPAATGAKPSKRKFGSKASPNSKRARKKGAAGKGAATPQKDLANDAEPWAESGNG